MKIAYASDIHTEFKGHKTPPLEEDVDVLILAGDIGKGINGMQWAHETYHARARLIIYVAGNHEYWGYEYKKALANMRAFASILPGFVFLQNEYVEFEGIRFLGATWWTDFGLGPDPRDLAMWLARDGMNDYKKIKWKTPAGTYRKFIPEDVLGINRESSKFLEETLQQFHDKKTIVVTHHAPTAKSLDVFFTGSKLNPCYANNWGDKIAQWGPDLWIHGHVHDDKDYMVGDRTRVLCNPIGYPQQIPSSGIKIIEG